MFARAFWAGDVCAGVLGGSSWQEMPLRGLVAATAAPFLHLSRGDRDRTVLAEWQVVKMVEALVRKVASWHEWSDCWRRGVHGVIVEMLVMAMFIVVLLPPKNKIRNFLSS